MDSGLILFNKKPGVTSFDALRDIKRALGTGKVGHTGTLDKFARGLLVVLTGSALKLSRWFLHCDKQYIGKIHFGVETDTLDPEGNVIAKTSPPSREETEKALLQFTGEILQSPPAYSAIHVGGKRASDLARRGEAPEMKKRPVHIYKLELLSWQPPFAEIFAHCSSGTYIRSLARDIALAAGSRAHLCELLRTKVANFSLKEFHTETQSHGGGEGVKDEIYQIKPITRDVISNLGLPYFEADKDEVKYIQNGKPLEPVLNGKSLFSSVSPCPRAMSFPRQTAAVFEGEELIAVVEKIDGKWKYGCVIAGNPSAK